MWRDFFNIFVLSQCIVYWLHFQNRHTFIYKKIFLHTLFCFFLKLSNAFSVSLILNKTLEVCSMKELMLIKQANQKSMIFVSNGFKFQQFQIKSNENKVRTLTLNFTFIWNIKLQNVSIQSAIYKNSPADIPCLYIPFKKNDLVQLC